MRIITFLSDFGTRDWFTAAVKGEIFKIAPDARVVDITHDIAPFDVRGAAFLLYAVYDNFPKETIHLAVVDPGVAVTSIGEIAGVGVSPVANLGGDTRERMTQSKANARATKARIQASAGASFLKDGIDLVPFDL